MDKSGNEMFYIDENGEKSDSLIHEEILAGGEYSLELEKELKAIAMECGLKAEEAELIYHCEDVMPEKKKAIHLPPDCPRIRGLKLHKLQPEIKQLIEDIADFVKDDKDLDLQIRDGYLNVYYKGGNLWKISELARSRGARFHFDEKYFLRGKDAPVEKPWLSDESDDFHRWKDRLKDLKQVMDGWFKIHPKSEREIQQNICSYHRNNENSPWLLIDIEYAAWLYDSTKGRRLCRFDMVAVERKNIISGQPLVLHLVELKQGNRALGGLSGIEKHAEDFRQFLTEDDNKKARDAFTESMRNIIREKSLLGLLPEVAIDAGNNIQLKVSFLLKECKVGDKEKVEIEKLEKLLAGHYTEQLFVDYESWIQS